MKPKHIIAMTAIISCTVLVILYWKFVILAGVLIAGILANAYARKLAPHTSTLFFQNRARRESGSRSTWSPPQPRNSWSSASVPTGRRSTSRPAASTASNIQNYYDAGGNPRGTSMANGMGGSDYYSRSGKYLGQTNRSGTFDAEGKPITSGQKLGDFLLGQDDD